MNPGYVILNFCRKEKEEENNRRKRRIEKLRKKAERKNLAKKIK